MTTIPTGSIVVGYDGSPSADRALEWAAREAGGEDRPLAVLHAAPPPARAGSAWLDSVGLDHVRVIESIQDEAERVVTAAAERARHAEPSVVVHAAARLDDPREALLEVATTARMVVVGTRGLGRVRSLVLGSVSSAIVKHATAPVVVVRPAPEPAPLGVVVGVGDQDDDEVLDLAFRVASARRLPITLIHCFWDSVKVAEGARDVADDEPGLEDRRRLLDDAGRAAAQRHPDVPVHRQLARGFVDRRLVEASTEAELVVVGRHATRLLDEIVFGSLAPTVAERARCSVAVVPVTGSSR